MKYKYETHLHTSQGSACGSSMAEDYVYPYYEAGYSGFFVTDHFFGGNTAVPRDLDWTSRINLYCSGYEKALETAKKLNTEKNILNTPDEFKVFFGIEQTFQGDDYLIYGLSKEWLLKHPEFERMNQTEVFEAVNMNNGLMIQAHPFRLRGYIQAIHIHPRDIHGIEILNAGNAPEENELAEHYAKIYNFPVTAGSDIHHVNKLINGDGGIPVTGMEFDKPLLNLQDYVERIKNHQGSIIR
ncbi:MAG: PHP domain-containing protein [Treponema sp.]|nr:PHP domain-containing protein [Treponema sp.]